MDLSGTWRAQVADDEIRRSGIGLEADDSHWVDIDVPGHWRDHPTFANGDGPLMYRTGFALEAPASGRRRWVTLDGIFYQADVWLDGAYLGDPEGYFFPHTFDITDLSRFSDEHVLAVEVTCSPQHSHRNRRNITGIFQFGESLDRSWNPGGLWRRVIVHETGPVRIHRLRVTCRDADESRAHLRLYAALDTDIARRIRLRTRSDGLALEESEHQLAEGINEIEWNLDVPRPALWWPRTLGDQHLTTIGIEVLVGGAISDQRERRTGFREVAWNDFVCSINGERLFLKGANLLPTRAGLANASADDVRADVDAALDAGLDALRVHGHIADRALYNAADEAGLLLLQDFPLQWEQARTVRRQAVLQAVEAVNSLGHHPSIVQWTAHNDPAASALRIGGDSGRSRVAAIVGQQLPSWNRTVLDRWVKRAFERADPSRPTVAHSGVIPHLPALSGTDSHLYYGWYTGDVEQLARLARTIPRLVRFVSEFGAQAVPNNAEFCEPERWPELDWKHLAAHHGLQKWVFDERLPPTEYERFEAWRDATQLYQAHVLRTQIETLRRLKYRPTGGFCFSSLADPEPAISWSVLDHRREPKLGWQAVRDACRQVIVVADPLAVFVNAGDELSVDLHVVNDTREAIPGSAVDASFEWAGGTQEWRFEGDIGADECVKVGTIEFTVPATLGALRLELAMAPLGITNAYTTAITIATAL